MLLRVLILCLLFALPSYGALLCSQAYEHAKPANTQEEVSTDYSSIFNVLHIEDAALGGKLISLSAKTGWTFASKENEPDVPGDIRLSILGLPATVRDAFGMKAFDQNGKELTSLKQVDLVASVRIPDMIAINNVIDFLNIKLEQKGFNKIPFKFFSSENPVPDKIYLEKILRQGLLPFGTGGKLALHDFNFHFIANLLLLPNWKNASLNHAKIMFHLEHWMQKNYPQVQSHPKFQEWLKEMYYEIAHKFDTHGNISKHSRTKRKLALKMIDALPKDENLQHTLRYFSISRSSPLESLQSQFYISDRLIARAFSEFADYAENNLPKNLLQKNFEMEKEINDPYLEQLLEQRMIELQIALKD